MIEPVIDTETGFEEAICDIDGLRLDFYYTYFDKKFDKDYSVYRCPKCQVLAVV